MNQQAGESMAVAKEPEIPPQNESSSIAAAAAETPSSGPDQCFEAQAQDTEDDTAESMEVKSSRHIRDLEDKLAAKEERLQATLVQYKEALDDFESAKARLRRDITKEIDAGKRALLGDLLEVVDNLERAIEAPGNAPGELLSGVKMVRDQFLAKLNHLGVRPVDAMGQSFDPSRFEAISTIAVSDPAQDGMVLGIIRSCYVMGGETLRYGMVAVGKFSSAHPEQTTPPVE